MVLLEALFNSLVFLRTHNGKDIVVTSLNQWEVRLWLLPIVVTTVSTLTLPRRGGTWVRIFAGYVPLAIITPTPLVYSVDNYRPHPKEQMVKVVIHKSRCMKTELKRPF